MDRVPDLIGELLAATEEIARTMPAAGDDFEKLLRRRGELILSLCSTSFDTSDERIATIVREGDALLARARSRRDSLRQELAGLNRLANLVDGMKSTIPQPGSAEVDVTA